MPITQAEGAHATSQPGENPPPVSADVIPVSLIASITVLWESLSCSLERTNGKKEGEEKDWMFILLVDDYHPSLTNYFYLGH